MMNIPDSNIVTLAIPHELSGLVVQSYIECGTHIKAKTASQRKASLAKRIKRLEQELALCTSAKERSKIEGEIKSLNSSQTHKGNRTNRDRKTIGMFIALKSITKSGVIGHYRSQQKVLEQYTKKNLRTIEYYLELLSEMGLVTITGRKGARNRNIQLASWEKLCDQFDLEYTKEFTLYQYDLNNPKQTPDYILDGAEEAEKQERLYGRLIRKIRSNQVVMDFLASHFNIKVINQKTIDQINSIRHSWFVNGFPSRSSNDTDFAYCVHILYNLNTCVSRTRKKIQNVRNFLQQRRVSYLKRALTERGIANVCNTVLKSNQNRVPNRNIQANGFDRLNKLATWFLPSVVEVDNFSVKSVN